MISLKHKYKAKKSQANGIKFPSKLEKNVYLVLKEHLDKGLIRNLFRQIPIYLDVGKYTVDFMIFTHDEVHFIEAKGLDLTAGKLRREQAEHREQITVHVVKSAKQTKELLEKLCQRPKD